jgi:DNA polymerase-3 subunit gamma/tau
MSYEVLARKWRPKVFEDVIGQEHITQTLINAIKTDRLAHAYLFSGARGVGKTSVARILARAINCKKGEPGIPCGQCQPCTEIANGSSVDVQEIDGASNRGIDEIRELRENIKYMPSSCKFRVYIIDEVHMLTLPAFNALLKTLEEPPPHVKFIFATTEPHKVPITILSRCQRFDFKRIPVGKILEQLERIAREEGIEANQSALALIARESEGSMRDAESLLDQVVSFTGARIEDKDISDILGIIDRDLVLECSRAIIDGSPEKCMQIVERIYAYGFDIKEFYRILMDQFRDLLISLVVPESDLLNTAGSDKTEIERQAKKAGLEKLQQSLNLLIAREQDLKFTSHPRLVLETIMIKLCHLGEVLSFDELMGKMDALEKRLSTFPAEELDRTGQISEPGRGWGIEKEGDREAETTDVPLAQKDWDGLLNHFASKNKAMANVLKDWHLVGVNGNTIEIAAGGNAFSSSYFDDSERLDKFTRICRDFFNKDFVIRIVNNPVDKKTSDKKLEKKKGEPEKKKHSDLPQSVQDVLQIFQGEIKG